MNKRGFTIIELLGAVVILGILAGIAVQAVDKNNRRSKEQAVFTIAKSAYEAVQSKISKSNTAEDSYNIVDLYKEGFMDRPLDPDNNGKDCTGTVKPELVEKTGTNDAEDLDSYKYTIKVECPSGLSDTVVFNPDGTYTSSSNPNPTMTGTPRPTVSNAAGDEDVDATYYTITYASGGGSGSMSSSLCKAGDPIIPKDNTFTNPGHTFLGWDGLPSDKKCDRDRTLTAKWSGLQYLVHYAANGGSGTMEDSYCTAGADIVTRTNTFTKAGYEFDGWSGKPDKCRGEVTLTANWKPGTYTVTYAKEPSDVEGTLPTAFTCKYGDDITLSTCDLTRTGYTCTGWSENLTKCPSQNKIITPTWKGNTYKVKYKAGGGKGKMSSSTCEYGSTIEPSENKFTRDYYKFDGWDGMPDDEICPGNITLTAKWKGNAVKIAYRIGTPNTRNFLYITPKGYHEGKTNDGYYFLMTASNSIYTHIVYGQDHLQSDGQGLWDPQCSTWLYIKQSEKNKGTPVKGKEWKGTDSDTNDCRKKLFDKNTDYIASDICDNKTKDCVCRVRVNWKS